MGDVRNPADVAAHAAAAGAHHARYDDVEAIAAADVAGHTAVAGAHHARYADAEATTAVAGSVFGLKSVNFLIHESDVAVAVADGKAGFAINDALNGMNLIDVLAAVHDKGITNTTDIQVRRRRAGANADMLSTKITIGDEFYTSDEVINGANDDVATGDIIYADVDAVHSGTAPNGLSIVLTFGSPYARTSKPLGTH